MQVHKKVDAAENYTINEMHFGVWLNLWFKTLDSLFKGEKPISPKIELALWAPFFISIFFKLDLTNLKVSNNLNFFYIIWY
ncbi:hypothetical protein GCM10011414_11480 [Croceivirga lutea]|nr:hypothetical protein GCM10011414_11480 [Croceivirga lutea]